MRIVLSPGEFMAAEYAIREQRDRRDLQRADLTAMIVRAIEALDHASREVPGILRTVGDNSAMLKKLLNAIVGLVGGAVAVAKFAVSVPAAAAVVATALAAYHDRLIDGAHVATRWVLLAAGVWFMACQLWYHGVRRRDPAAAFAGITLVGSAGVIVALAVQEYVPAVWLRAWTGASDGPGLMLPGVGAVWCAVAVTCTLGDASRNRPRPCPTCRELIRPGARKCRYCQTDLPGEWTVACPGCAETVLADATGCRHCGYTQVGRAYPRCPARGSK